MKLPIIAGIIAASFTVTSVMAENVNSSKIPPVTAAQAPIVDQVTKDVKASPEKAAEIVKKAILDSKADPLLVAQIMRAAMLAAPDQVGSIYSMVIAVAPDSMSIVNLMVAAISNGDEVAALNSRAVKDLLSKIFQNTTDISVDDDNKNVKVLVSREVLKMWSDATDGKNVEVKLDSFIYFTNFGNNSDNSQKYKVIIIEKDSNTTPPPV